MATVLQSSLDVILLNLQAQLMAWLSWSAERVIIDTEGDESDDETHYQADQVVFIRKGSQSPVPGFEGMGRIWSPERVRISCVLWTRNGLDEPPGFAIGLTAPLVGHEVTANLIRQALLEFAPIDVNSNWLVQQPIEPGGSDGPRRRNRHDRMWARSSVNFFLTYAPFMVDVAPPALPLPPPVPPPPPPPNPHNDTTAPIVALTSPAALAAVFGTINVTASASDNVGVVGVQFRLDGVNLGSEDLASPYSVSWDTTGAVDGWHTLDALARDAAGNVGTAAPRNVSVNNAPLPPPPSDTTPPLVSITFPADGAAVFGTITVTANASDDIGVVGVQFALDGANLGAEDLASPYSVSWNTATASDGFHVLRAVARDAAGNTTTSAAITVTSNNAAPPLDTTPPVTTITSPTEAVTVSGTITVIATATDNVGVVGVQFKLDGANLGAEDLTSPYSTSWNTTGAANGWHVLTSVARDAAGNVAASAPRNVSVNNTTPPVIPATDPMGLVMDSMMDVRAIANGLWSAPSTWSTGVVPLADECVLIGTGKTVTLDTATNTIHCMRIDGTLNFAPSVPTHLHANTTVVSSTGALNVGTLGSPITSTANVTFAAGAIDRVADPLALGRGIIQMAGGKITVVGQVKTSWDWLTAGASIGATSFTLEAGAPTNWAIGDKLVLPGVSGTVIAQVEELTVTGVVGAVVSFTPSLAYNHIPPVSALGIVSRMFVANLSSNINFTSRGGAASVLAERGHIMMMSNDNVWQDCRISYMGRTDKRIALNDSVLDANSALVAGTGTNQRGRYAIHWHRCGGLRTDPFGIANRVKIDNSMSWGLVCHASYVKSFQCVAYNHIGANFYTEAGSEIGSFDYCAAILSVGDGTPLGSGVETRKANQDFGHEGHGFWSQCFGMSITNCVSANSFSNGMIYYGNPLIEPDGTTTHFLAANLTDPTIAHGRTLIPVREVPLAAFTGNTVFSSSFGITISYMGGIAPSLPVVRNAVGTSTLWNIAHNGLALNYSSHVDVNDLHAYGCYACVLIGVESVDDNVVRNPILESSNTGVNMGLQGSHLVTGGSIKCTQGVVVPADIGSTRTETITGVTFSGADSSVFMRTFASVLATYGPARIMTTAYTFWDGVQIYSPEQLPAFVPFPSATATGLAPDVLLDLTNQQLWDTYGVAVAGTLIPSGATLLSGTNGYSGGSAPVYLPALTLVSASTVAVTGTGVSPVNYTLKYKIGSGSTITDPTIEPIFVGWNAVTRTILGLPRTFFVRGT